MGIRWNDMCKIHRTVPGLCLCHMLLLWFLLCSHQFNGLEESLQYGRTTSYKRVFHSISPLWQRMTFLEQWGWDLPRKKVGFTQVIREKETSLQRGPRTRDQGREKSLMAGTNLLWKRLAWAKRVGWEGLWGRVVRVHGIREYELLKQIDQQLYLPWGSGPIMEHSMGMNLGLQAL